MTAPSENNIPWEKRLPGEQWLILDSPETAEQYLHSFETEPNARVLREVFPNDAGLYAKVRFADRIPENRIYIQSEE